MHGHKIKISSGLLKTLYTTQFEGVEYVPWNEKKTIGFQREYSFFS